jgi:hypothetical protein
MTRSRFYSTVFPTAAIIYVIVLVATNFNGKVAVIGALCFALIAVLGAAALRSGDSGRQRDRSTRYARRSAR